MLAKKLKELKKFKKFEKLKKFKSLKKFNKVKKFKKRILADANASQKAQKFKELRKWILKLAKKLKKHSVAIWAKAF